MKKAKLKKRKINYNIEIKIGKWGTEIPYSNALYWNLVEAELSKVEDPRRIIIQCFEGFTLKFINKVKNRNFRLSYLSFEKDVNVALNRLDFVPDIYSPYFQSIDSVGVNRCHSKNVSVIPFVIDDEKIFSLYKNRYRVDGIITDYPKKMIEKIKAGAL